MALFKLKGISSDQQVAELDSEGNLVVVELKKSQAPREVVAQILEYAAWANELSEEAIAGIAASYFGFASDHSASLLNNKFLETFDVDARPKLKSRIRLSIAADRNRRGCCQILL